MVGRWSMVVHRGVVRSRSRGVVHRGMVRSRSRSMVRSRSWGAIDSLPLIGYIRDKTPVVVSMVGHVLGSAVREQDRVGTLHVPVGVRDLSSIEVGSMIIIVNTILVLVGTRFLKMKCRIKIFQFG